MPKKKTKILIVILLVIDIISLGVFVFLFSFTKNLIAESIDKENDIKTELKKEDIRILMKGDLSLSKIYQKELANYMIPSGGTVDFIKTLEQLSLNSGVKSDIKTVASEKYNEGDSIGEELLRINMNITGEWKNVEFFLSSLENYPLKIDIKNISLDKFSEYIVKGKSIPEWAGNFEFTVVKIKDAK